MAPEDKNREQTLTEQEYEALVFQKAREVVLSLANTISALKIFPPHHASAVHFRQDFISKLKAFLDQFQKLELEIGEFAFTARASRSTRMKFPARACLSFSTKMDSGC